MCVVAERRTETRRIYNRKGEPQLMLISRESIGSVVSAGGACLLLLLLGGPIAERGQQRKTSPAQKSWKRRDLFVRSIVEHGSAIRSESPPKHSALFFLFFLSPSLCCNTGEEQQMESNNTGHKQQH
jgi:hypothetical protein